MEGVHTPTRPWVVLALWVLASLAGWAVGMTLGALFTTAGSKLFGLNEDRVLAYAVGIAVGIGCGIAQSTVLRSYLPEAWRWAPVTAAGWLLALAIFAAAAGTSVGLSDPVLLLLFGAAVGVPQWLLLRRHLRGAGVWVLASAAGFLAFLWLVAHPAGSAGEFIAAGAILGMLAAVPTGLALAWILNRANRQATIHRP